MEFPSFPFDEYQTNFSPFGVDAVSLQSPSSLTEQPDSLFGHNPSSFTDDMPDVCVTQDSTDSISFVAEADSPFLPTSGSVSESTGSNSPLSSPGEGCIEIKQEPSYSAVDVPSIDVSPKSISIAPERKRKRKQSAETKTPHKQTGKKRKAQSENSGELNPDELVQMNSIELENLYGQLTLEGRLGMDEDRSFRKIIRQVKNRESAQASRIRRRDYINLIEAKLKHQELVDKYLRDYANQLKGLLVENGVQVPPEPEIPEFVPPPPVEMSIVEPSRTLVRPLRTAGICLMIVVLSVGILFNAMHHQVSGSSVQNVTNGNSENTIVSEPTPVSPSGRVIVDGSSASIGHLQTPSPETESNSETPSNVHTQDVISESSHSNEVASLDVIRNSAYLSYATDKVDSSLALVIPDEKQQVATSSSSVSSIVPATCPKLPYTSRTLFANSQPHLADRSWTLGNTSYILVNDATEFVPRSVYTNSVQTRTEPVFGLLLPASSFNISNSAPDDVVELICGVRNANLVPRRVLSNSLY